MGTGRCPAVALWLKAGQAGNVQLVCLRCRVASYSTLFSVLELSPEQYTNSETKSERVVPGNSQVAESGRQASDSPEE